MRIDRTKNAIRNMIWGYAYRAVAVILPFVLRTVIIRCMGADYAGINGLFTAVLQVLNLSELGFGVAIVYSMYEPVAQDDKSKVCALLNVYKRTYKIIGATVTVLGICIGPFVKMFVSGDYPKSINLHYVYFLFLFNTSISYFLSLYRSALINAFQRNDLESKAMLVVSVVRYGLEIAGAYITRNYYLILYIELASTLLLNTIRLFITNREFGDYKACGEISEMEKRIIRENVAALVCHKIGGTVLNSVDTIVISAFIGVVTVSNYGNYYYIISAVESIVLILFSGLTAGIGNSFILETPQKNALYFQRVLFFNAWIVIMLTNCLVAVCQDFVSLWVGKQYLFDDRIMLLFAVYFFVHNIRRTIITFRDGAGMWKDNKWQPIVSAAANMMINIMLVQSMGLYGILLSSILCMILIDIPWETKAFCRVIRMGVQTYIIALISYSIISISIGGITLFVCSLLHLPLLVNIMAKLLIAVFISTLLLCYIYRYNKHYCYYKGLIISHLCMFQNKKVVKQKCR